jgi:hypothetical protein
VPYLVAMAVREWWAGPGPAPAPAASPERPEARGAEARGAEARGRPW